MEQRRSSDTRDRRGIASLLLASPLAASGSSWLFWSVTILRPAHARFARTSTLPAEVNMRMSWTFRWPLFLAVFTAALAAVGVALLLSRHRGTQRLGQ